MAQLQLKVRRGGSIIRLHIDYASSLRVHIYEALALLTQNKSITHRAW